MPGGNKASRGRRHYDMVKSNPYTRMMFTLNKTDGPFFVFNFDVVCYTQTSQNQHILDSRHLERTSQA